MSDQHQISEEELHAYVDGSLAAHRREEIDRLLETNDELAARVSDYFSLNNMFHERYDRVLSEPVPARLLPAVKRHWYEALNWPQFAGMAATLILGVGIGVGTNMGREAVTIVTDGAGNTIERRVSAEGPESFARQSAIAHVL